MNPYQTNQSDSNGQHATDTHLWIIQYEGNIVVLMRKNSLMLLRQCMNLCTVRRYRTQIDRAGVFIQGLVEKDLSLLFVGKF